MPNFIVWCALKVMIDSGPWLMVDDVWFMIYDWLVEVVWNRNIFIIFNIWGIIIIIPIDYFFQNDFDDDEVDKDENGDENNDGEGESWLMIDVFFVAIYRCNALNMSIYCFTAKANGGRCHRRYAEVPEQHQYGCICDKQHFECWPETQTYGTVTQYDIYY